ncbi:MULTISPECIES: UPF0058 family protein [Natronococcus]|uniref:Metal-binding protein n=2 Tax=Natronococcus TaxID=29287 RepID=L9WXK9_9EURY|nr:MULTISPECIES: UPF0058 family protein [Natronococcus]ELY53078.1 hypothetical protein C492_18504 [Natronococcus jeotgali DSM 18795]ELY58200.1 hypothetical protein C491_10404 [Natronococcus amylolyticus DSM 10524]MDG5759730.1 UPF0058 family protein [Natronococcus sp. A-GB1]NKE36490.1 metal-binding protein [Natronococcus sp. JC468]
MKKQELIHLHGLLAEVSNQCAEWENCQIDLEEYESRGIRPTSIHKSKTDHKAAVFALAGGITTNMREDEQEAVAATAD